MEWLEAVYGAIAGGGLVKVWITVAKTLRDNRTDTLQAEEDLREDLRKECKDLRSRNVKLETDRRECFHKLGNAEQTIVLLKWKVEQLGGEIPPEKENSNGKFW